MNESAAFVGRELLRILHDAPALDTAFDRLNAALPENLRAASQQLQRDLQTRDFGPIGDVEQDTLRVAVRCMRLAREHGGRHSPEAWADLERQHLANRQLSSTLVSGMVRTLCVCAATASVAVVIGVIYVLFVLPQFESMLLMMGGQLPKLTSAVLAQGRALFVLLPLAFMVLAAFAFPVRPSWQAAGRVRGWRLDLFARRALFGRELAREYRKVLFIAYAAALARSGVSPRKALAIARQEAGIYQQVDFESGVALSAAAALDALAAALLSADRLGHLPQELDAQREARRDALRQSADRFQERTSLIMRTVLYLLVATLVVAMYLPIFQVGAAV